jgi:hypothetical protein
MEIADIKSFMPLCELLLLRHRFSRNYISPTLCAEISMGTVPLNGKSNLVCTGCINFVSTMSSCVNEKPSCVKYTLLTEPSYQWPVFYRPNISVSVSAFTPNISFDRNWIIQVSICSVCKLFVCNSQSKVL